MALDDLLATLNVAQNPALEAVRQMDKLASRAAAQHIAHAALLQQRMTPALSASHTLAAGQSGREWMKGVTDIECSASRAAMGEFSNLAHVIKQADFRLGRTLADTQARLKELVDVDRVMDDMTRKFGAVLPGYAAYLARIERDMDAARNALLNVDIYSAFERDLRQLACAATALELLRHLTYTMAAAFDGVLAREAIEHHLNTRQWRSVEADGIRAWRSIASLIKYPEGYDDLVDVHGDDTPSLDEPVLDEVCAPRADDVRQIASRLGMLVSKLDARLRCLASRVDSAAIGGTASWDQMIWSVASGFPKFGAGLLQLARLFQQHLALLAAPSGTLANGQSEQLSLGDVEAFEMLTHAMLGELHAIEDSIGP